MNFVSLSSAAMKQWIKTTNIYEVNLRQYTPEGTINAFVEHLPRLHKMGVETLWFMPLTPIAQKNKKGTMGSYYACSDYTSVNEEFGTLDDFKLLVIKAHSMGFKIIIDWVANHTGMDHLWTREHPDWYEKDEQTGDFKKASGMDDIIELDFKNPDLRKAMIDAMTFWVVETGIDGFRCDLAFWVQLDFWVEAKKELDKVKDLFWLGELDALEHPGYMQVFDAAYTWTWMHKTEQFYKGQLSFTDLMQVLQRYKEQPGAAAWFTTNHDENSWNGTEYEKYGALAKALAVFSCTWPGLPLVYSGQELPNYKRLQFFEKDEIEWSDKIELHDFYKTLFELRKSNALATDASVSHIQIEHTPALIFIRSSGVDKIGVAINFSAAKFDVEMPDTWTDIKEIFSSDEIAVSSKQKIVLPPWGFSIFRNNYGS